MTKRILDFDPLSGHTTYFEYDHASDRMIITESGNVEQSLERAAALRQNPEYSKRGIKNDFWHFAHVDVMVQYRMLHEDGVNFHDKNDWPRVFQLLNTKYAKCKTTDGVHNIKHA